MPNNNQKLPVKVTIIKKPVSVKAVKSRHKSQNELLEIFKSGFDFLASASKAVMNSLITNGGSGKVIVKSKMSVFQGRPIVLTHTRPILTPKERAQKKREIESQLYEIFSKYQ
jgi:hypothetical protein